MRVFIGMRLNDCINDIVMIQEQLRIKGVTGNYTLFENIHSTLFFLGELSVMIIDKVKKAMDNLCYSSIEVEIINVNNIRDIVILELRRNKEIIMLYEGLKGKLIEQGFEIEQRPFYPHITLVRKSNMIHKQKVSLKSQVNEIVLFSSKRINGRLLYNPIYKKSLRSNK